MFKHGEGEAKQARLNYKGDKKLIVESFKEGLEERSGALPYILVIVFIIGGIVYGSMK